MDFSHLLDNQLISGGMVLGVVGFAIAWAKSLPSHVFTWFKKHCTVTVEVTNRDEAFVWLNAWLEKKLSSVKHTIAGAKYANKDGDSPRNGEIIVGRPRFMLTPCRGMHFGWFGKIPMWVVRTRKDEDKSNGGWTTLETFHLTFMTRRREVLNEVLKEALDTAVPKDNRVEIRAAFPKWNEWRLIDRVHPRSLSSVILPAGIKESVLADIQQFRTARNWYDNLGIPYRRGFLFYGPPGNGKTSMGSAVAGELGLNIYILSLNSPDLDDDTLLNLLMEADANAIILIEDIDAAFVKRQKADKDAANRVTFSGLLNALDGVASKPGRILFMTTNHIERLDPALIREGRVDVKLEIGNATQEQAQQMFLKFHGPQYNILSHEFAARVEPGRISMASIQEYMLRHRGDPVGCAENVLRLAEPPVFATEYQNIYEPEPEAGISGDLDSQQPKLLPARKLKPARMMMSRGIARFP